MAKRAVCIGINDYPGTGSDLNGCVNDAEDWATLLKDFGFGGSIRTLRDAEATRANILGALGDLISGAGADDVVVFTYSGHGTWVYDRGTRDESDNRDEAVCAHDGNVVDDELRAILRTLHPEARCTVILDSCHSGSATRAQLRRQRARSAAEADDSRDLKQPRFLPPENEMDALRAELLPVRKRIAYPEAGMAELLLTGCNATEYSYDAYLGGRYNGAMTHFAQRLIRIDPNASYREFHKRLRELLPSTRYPQSPQLEGSDAMKDRPLFR